MEDLGATSANKPLRNTIHHLAARADHLLDMGENLASQVSDWRLVREIEVIVALARNNVARLRVEDPLQGGGRTRKPKALFITMATLIRSLCTASPTKDKRTADDTGL